MDEIGRVYLWLFDSEHGAKDRLIARWLFLRAMGLIYFSAFYALLFQVEGLIGAQGILPANEYLADARAAGLKGLWYVPSLLWLSSSNHMLMALMWMGLIAALFLVANLWPRAMLLVCFVCYLSFVAAAQDFSGYQSDGMLLEAGFISLFLAPTGLWPGWGARRPPARAAILLLLWEWFRIYFESGVVKLLSGDRTWRNLTAMYQYYQNGPLPTWIGWYVQHLPNWFHKATAGATLAMELVLVWMAFLPGRWRIACFVIVTAWQIGVIATANYTFLNYLVLVLAILLLDDGFLRKFVPVRWREKLITGDTEESGEHREVAGAGEEAEEIAQPQPAVTSMAEAGLFSQAIDGTDKPVPLSSMESGGLFQSAGDGLHEPIAIRQLLHSVWVAITALFLTWVFYATSVEMLAMFWQEQPLPVLPVAALEPFRIANQYGLFAVMTPHRYEIEFQGSNDGENWVAYPFRYKPQDVHARPRIYAPYQPRFDWNLWFASLGSWMQNPMVPRTEELLLQNDQDVLGLFAGNPFPKAPPKYVRAVIWQYWFSTPEEKREQGIWWTRQELGTYAPMLTPLEDGRYGVVAGPSRLGPPEPDQ